MPLVEQRGARSKTDLRMEGLYCVYNQTSECFLSLAVQPGGSAFSRIKERFAKGSRRSDEGTWVKDPSWLHTFGMSSPRDLIYIDENHRVVDIVEGFSGFKLAAAPIQASTLLVLPLYTIVTSQTRPGNQLLVCVAEEMQFRLRDIPKPPPEHVEPDPEAITPAAMDRWFARKSKPDRRTASRKRWPRLVAFDASGEAVKVHGVRDISATGLYLLTEERWPLGTQVKMSLQRTDGESGDAMFPITVDLKVCRWGHDGLGLQFLQTHAEQSVRLAQVR